MQHLKRSKGKVKKYFIIFCDGFTESHEDHIVDAKQRNQQECGFGQPPERETVIYNYFMIQFKNKT